MRRAVPWLLTLNVVLLVATSETTGTPVGAEGGRCEAVALEPAAFEADEDGRLVLAVVGTDGTEIRTVRGEIDALGCAAVVEIGGAPVAGEGSDDGAEPDGHPLVLDASVDGATEVVLTVDTCAAARVETALEVDACAQGPIGVVLEQR